MKLLSDQKRAVLCRNNSRSAITEWLNLKRWWMVSVEKCCSLYWFLTCNKKRSVVLVEEAIIVYDELFSYNILFTNRQVGCSG